MHSLSSPVSDDKQKLHRKRKIEANRMRKNGMPVASPSPADLEDEEGNPADEGYPHIMPSLLFITHLRCIHTEFLRLRLPLFLLMFATTLCEYHHRRQFYPF